jgi:hypothetical protein
MKAEIQAFAHSPAPIAVNANNDNIKKWAIII